MLFESSAARSIGVLLGVASVSSCASPPAPSTHLEVGALLAEVASDGTTVVVASLVDPSGQLVVDRFPPVYFASACGRAGTATFVDSVDLVDGVAATAYQPQGCLGTDVVTATVTLDGIVYEGRVSLLVRADAGLTERGTLGKALFFDAALSASGAQSCADCHAPQRAYGAVNADAVPLGGPYLDTSGFRSTPSAAYASFAPTFVFEDAATTNVDPDVARGAPGVPFGGQMADGRAVDTAAQAVGPFTGPHEMANVDAAEVLDRLVDRPYLALFEAVYGTTSGADPDAVLESIADAIAAYEAEDASFHPLNSKFDAVETGRARFTAQEARGRELFESEEKGACLGCHDSSDVPGLGPQLFSDFRYRALGVPRNWEIPYNVDTLAAVRLDALGLSSLKNGASVGSPDHVYYDLGACGPFRTDAALDATLCGAFRVSPLRNVALKGAYFHNGVFDTLREVIEFYVGRDATPERFYRTFDDAPDVPLNDLPAAYAANVDRMRAPFRAAAAGPRLTPDEIDDLITFLCTLTDGFDPARPDAYRLPRQCREAVR